MELIAFILSLLSDSMRLSFLETTAGQQVYALFSDLGWTAFEDGSLSAPITSVSSIEQLFVLIRFLSDLIN